MSEIQIISPENVTAYLGVGGRKTRVLLDPDTGHPELELYHVELGPNDTSEVHIRDHPETIFILEGVAGVKTKEMVHQAEAGQVILIPSHIEHQHINVGNSILRFLGIFAPPTGNASDVRSRKPVERTNL